MGARLSSRTGSYQRILLTRRTCAGPTGVTGRAVSGRVEGGESDQVRRVARQVGEMHTGVRHKNHLDLLGLVLLVPLPVVDLETSR